MLRSRNANAESRVSESTLIPLPGSFISLDPSPGGRTLLRLDCGRSLRTNLGLAEHDAASQVTYIVHTEQSSLRHCYSYLKFGYIK